MKKEDMNNIKNEKKLKHIEGFSLIETLVAISILILIITGPLVLVNKNLTLMKIARQRVIASYLAQEGVEYVRNIRDENLLKSDPWLSGMADCVSNNGIKKCTVDTVNSRASDFKGCSGDCENLKFEDSTSLYGYDSSSEETKYKRELYIILDGEQAIIKVIVDWGSDSSVVEDTIYEWF